MWYLLQLFMGRKSRAKIILESQEFDEDTARNWLVIYDFQGLNPSHSFWKNIKRISIETGHGRLVQYSAYETRSLYGASAVVSLVKQYRGQVDVYQADKVNLSTKTGKTALI